MDSQRFDELSKIFAKGLTRRQVLRSLAGGLAGLSLQRGASAAGCRSAGRTCREHANCCSGICASQNGRKVCVCPTGTTNCDGDCLDPATFQSDVNNCGSCGNRCSAVANGTTSCAGGACEVACDAGYHLCNGVCVSDASPDSCGSSCDPCPAPANGTPVCLTGLCSFVCDPGYHQCGDECLLDTSPNSCGTSCAPCPAPANGTPICIAGACAVLCDSGFHSCNGACVAEDSTDACGDSCTPCVDPPNGFAVCDGGTCAFVCHPGYKPCGDTCIVQDACCAGNSCADGYDPEACGAAGSECFCQQTVEGDLACGQDFVCLDLDPVYACTSTAGCVAVLGQGYFCRPPDQGCCFADQQICVPRCGFAS